MPHDVFISYSSQDKLTADATCATLEARGIRCWIAPRDIVPGQDWSDAIIDALTGAKVFLLLLSCASNESEQVKREIQNAVSEGLPIVPLRIEDVPLSKHMRYFIGTPHWLDAMTPPLEAHLERLSQTVHALLQVRNREDAEDMLELPDSPLVASGSDFVINAPPVRVPGSNPPLHAPASPPVNPPASQAPASQAPASQAPASQALEWNPDDLREIERELAAFIGPMARVLVHGATQTTHDLLSLCQKVSQYVANEPDRERFLERVSHLARFGATTTQKEVAPAPRPVPEPTNWDAETLHVVERQLAEFIGPLARVLVKRASQKAVTLDELYGALAENLTVPKERQTFLQGRRQLS